MLSPTPTLNKEFIIIIIIIIMEIANVVPIHKKNEKNVKGNYRPISLFPIFGKILEKIIYDFLYSHLVSHELLNSNPIRFSPRRFDNQPVTFDITYYFQSLRL